MYFSAQCEHSSSVWGSVPGAHTLIYNRKDWQPVKSVAHLQKMQDLQVQHKLKNAGVFLVCLLSRLIYFIDTHSCVLHSQTLMGTSSRLMKRGAKWEMLRLHIVWAAAGWLMGGFSQFQQGKKIFECWLLKLEGPEGTRRLCCHHLLGNKGVKEGLHAAASVMTWPTV